MICSDKFKTTRTGFVWPTSNDQRVFYKILRTVLRLHDAGKQVVYMKFFNFCFYNV